jgi:prevent-host-death family protein
MTVQSVSAHQAKARFGQLLDAARVDPVTIEKHGRPVAVLVSIEEYDSIEAMKLERLRAEVERGIDAIERGDFTEYDEADLDRLATRIKAEARKRSVGS